jgi:hypothetical protein
MKLAILVGFDSMVINVEGSLHGIPALLELQALLDDLIAHSNLPRSSTLTVTLKATLPTLVLISLGCTLGWPRYTKVTVNGITIFSADTASQHEGLIPLPGTSFPAPSPVHLSGIGDLHFYNGKLYVRSIAGAIPDDVSGLLRAALKELQLPRTPVLQIHLHGRLHPAIAIGLGCLLGIWPTVVVNGRVAHTINHLDYPLGSRCPRVTMSSAQND